MDLNKLLKQAKTKLRQAEKAEVRSILRCAPLKLPYRVMAGEGHVDGPPPPNPSLQEFLRLHTEGIKGTIAGWHYEPEDYHYSPLSNRNIQVTGEALYKDSQIVLMYNEDRKYLTGAYRLIFFADSRKPLYDFCEDFGISNIIERDMELRVRL